MNTKVDSLQSLIALLALLLAGLAFCVALYVLSSGPALYVTMNTGVPTHYWNIAYWPLTYARDVVPGFHETFQWYLGVWTR